MAPLLAYLQAQVNQYVTEKYNPIVTKEHFVKMFVIGGVGFSFRTYSINAMEGFVGFTANRLHYMKDDDAYYIDSRVNIIQDKL